jgi:hypothetical protein
MYPTYVRGLFIPGTGAGTQSLMTLSVPVLIMARVRKVPVQAPAPQPCLGTHIFSLWLLVDLTEKMKAVRQQCGVLAKVTSSENLRLEPEQ